MTIYSKPNYNLGVWASNGNVVAPTSEKIEIGHVIEKPKNEQMNWIQNRQDSGIAYILQNGISDWDTQTEYPINAYVRYNGTLYQAISQNIDKQPDTNPSIWKISFASYSDFVTLSSEVNSIKNTDGYLTHYVRISEPVMTGKCLGAGYTADIGIVSTGSEALGYSFNVENLDGLFHDGDSPVVQNDGDVVAIFKEPASITEVTKVVVTMDVLQQAIAEAIRVKVGGLHLTTNNINPSVELGYGTWQRYAEGKALVGVSDQTTDPSWTRFVGSTEGVYSESVNIPHTNWASDYNEIRSFTRGNLVMTSGFTEKVEILESLAPVTTSRNLTFNRVQPSITIHVWKRIS